MSVRVVELELPPEFFGPGSTSDSEALLRTLLDLTVAANLMHLRANPETPLLARSGVRWREPHGAKLSSIPAVLARGHASCASLSCWRAAELRHAGYGASPVVRRQGAGEGRLLYHVVVSRWDGRLEDPSRALGMGG